MDLTNLFSLGILGIGLFLILVGIYWLFKNMQLKSRSVLHSATVVEHKKDRSVNGELLHYPIVRFQTKTGEQRKLKYPKGSFEIEIEEGETVDVLYDSSKEQLTLNSNFWLIFMPVFVIFLGIGSMALGLLLN